MIGRLAIEEGLPYGTPNLLKKRGKNNRCNLNLEQQQAAKKPWCRWELQFQGEGVYITDWKYWEKLQSYDLLDNENESKKNTTLISTQL